MAWDLSGRESASFTIKVMDSSGAVKSYTRNFTTDNGSEAKYSILWHPLTSMYDIKMPTEEQIVEIATKIAKIYGGTAKMTQLVIGDYSLMKA